jgi:glutamate-5-semialdehyde dehydrogenase
METTLNDTIVSLCKAARVASRALARSSGDARNAAIKLMRTKLIESKNTLMEANATDVEEAKRAGLPGPLIKRLAITDKVFDYMASRLTEVADLPDPVGRVLEGHVSPAGLRVEKVSVPIGVIALIYESRPNVTTDAASVCVKSGNAVILRGGSESLRSNMVLAVAMRDAAICSGLPADTIQAIGTKDHEAVTCMLAQEKYIDVIIPRGGKDLIGKIATGTRIPVIKHYEGICHIYIAEDADADMAVRIAVNSKCQSVEVCNAMETLLVDGSVAPALLPILATVFAKKGVELRGCAETMKYIPGCKPAIEEDWRTEYLAPILSVRVVRGVKEAANHINTYGSGHTDGIVTQSLALARYFVEAVDSASVLVNASTRLSGGGEYGLGAVVGISTDKLHARGPVGPNELTTYKWVAYGDGHLRE